MCEHTRRRDTRYQSITGFANYEEFDQLWALTSSSSLPLVIWIGTYWLCKSMSSPRAFHYRRLREPINGCVALYCLLNLCFGSFLSFGAIYRKSNRLSANPSGFSLSFFCLLEKNYHFLRLTSAFLTVPFWDKTCFPHFFIDLWIHRRALRGRWECFRRTYEST
jgi:hypothetical protein